MQTLLSQIKQCQVCKTYLPGPPRPVLQAGPLASIVIIGQAPGKKVDTTGIPWDDASGNELRRWLGVTKEQFYNKELFALVPMGFCYPGKGKSGDLPPRPECAPLWHRQILQQMPQVGLILLIGQYAQQHYLADALKPTLTENVKNFKAFLPMYLPLVHPSPRNRIWQKKNPWFEADVLPALQAIVKKTIVH